LSAAVAAILVASLAASADDDPGDLADEGL